MGTKRDWKNYAEVTNAWEPSKQILTVSSLLPPKAHIIDLGAGGMRDTRFLASHGHLVTAVDAEPHVLTFTPTGVTCIVSRLEEYDFPYEAFDLVNAQWTLPFVQREMFDSFFAKMLATIRRGGHFTGQLYGIKDEWNTSECDDIVFHTPEDIERLFQSMHIREVEEELGPRRNQDGTTKVWHVYHIIATKG